MRKQLSVCTCCGKDGFGGLTAHCVILTEDRKIIHSLFPEKMSCMDIVHSVAGKEIWRYNHRSTGGGGSGVENNDTQIQRSTNPTSRVGVRTKHAVVQELRMLVEQHVVSDDNVVQI